MNLFDVASGLLSAAILALIAYYQLSGRPDIPRLLRLGVNIMAAGIIFTLAERLFPGSPFQDWSFVLLRVGFVLCLVWAIWAAPFPSDARDEQAAANTGAAFRAVEAAASAGTTGQPDATLRPGETARAAPESDR